MKKLKFWSVHHNPCLNLFIPHNIPFDNQGSETNKNDIFLHFDIFLIFMSKDSSGKYYQNNKERLQKKVLWKILKSFWRRKRKKSDTLVRNRKLTEDRKPRLV